MAGRKSKYTPETVKKILDALKVGATRRAASGAAGINEDTLCLWVKQYSDFSDSVTRAEDEAEARFTSILAKAANPHEVMETVTTEGPDGTTTRTTIKREFDWRAAESWLKRRRRFDWGDRVDFGKYSDEELIAEAEKLFGGSLSEILQAATANSPHED